MKVEDEELARLFSILCFVPGMIVLWVGAAFLIFFGRIVISVASLTVGTMLLGLSGWLWQESRLTALMRTSGGTHAHIGWKSHLKGPATAVVVAVLAILAFLTLVMNR